MTDAITAPVIVNTTGRCTIFPKNCPTTLLGEKIISRIKPSTVGGRTIGNSIKLSRSLVRCPFPLYSNRLIKMPKIETIIVLMMATFIDIQKGVKSGIY